MSTQTKKIFLQTFLLLLVPVIVLLFSLFNNWGHALYYLLDLSYFFIYLCLTLFIFLPITALYIIRRSDSKVLGKIFRGTAYLSSFVAFFFFLVNIFPYMDYGYLAYPAYNDGYIMSEKVGHLLATLVYFLLMVIFYLAAKMNKSLNGEKFSLISEKEKEIVRYYLVIFSILISLAVFLYLWHKAASWAYILEEAGIFTNPELIRQGIQDTYNMAFKKIFFIVGFIFASTFLLLKVMPNKK